MLEEIIEKLKEYKLFVGLAVVGTVLGGFFLIKGNHQPRNQVAALSQEVTSSSSSADEESEKFFLRPRRMKRRVSKSLWILKAQLRILVSMS